MATRHLGELGKKREPVDMVFDWFGEPIRVGPHAGDLTLIDFLERARQIDTSDHVTSMVVTKKFLHEQIDERDWPRLLELAVANNQQFSDLLQLSRDIVEAVTRFPTGPQSGSSDGRPTTKPKSTDTSSSAVAQAMRALKGRPDLKMAIWEAQKARAAEAATADT